MDGLSLARPDHIIISDMTKPGKVTVPHPKKDLPNGTVRSIMKQAGLAKTKD
jgi:predicted RNA binding protein YcfA (HicA-like mRNA interferase family)